MENVTDEVDSSEVDLSSFALHDELFPGFWNGNDGLLNSRIRLKLLDIADDFWKSVNISWVKPKMIILTGSICNYNWSQYSDVDLHLVADFKEIDERTDFVRDYLDMKKNEWNDTHDHLEILGRSIELYVQDVDDDVRSGGIYDLEENKWIRKPSFSGMKPIGNDSEHIKQLAADIMTIIDGMHHQTASIDDKHKLESIGDDAYYLWKKIRAMRSRSLETEGENSVGNIVYKILRRTKYLDKLFDLMAYTYDEVNSIEEGMHRSDSLLLEYLDKDYNYPLYKYFKWADSASPCELARDVMGYCSYLIPKYIHEKQYDYDFGKLAQIADETEDMNDYYAEDFLDALKENDLCDDFVNFCQYNADYMDLPAWMTMSFNKIVKNEWCIHFTDYAKGIAMHGFTGGTEEIDALAYTNAGHEKPSEGYDFAFLINDDSVDFNDYGDEAVIFRTSGIEVTHYGDEQNQVIFWGKYAKDFIPIYLDNEDGDWKIYGKKGQVLMSGKPSELARWATENVAQYRRQVLFGKNGRRNYIEGIERYANAIKLLKEEVVGDGDGDHNPYAKRWDAERKALKDFICKYGKVMTSKENGKTYKVYYDKTLSELIGYNYCVCLQWDNVKMKSRSILYIRALDKFTDGVVDMHFDKSGRDNTYQKASNDAYSEA